MAKIGFHLNMSQVDKKCFAPIRGGHKNNNGYNKEALSRKGLKAEDIDDLFNQLGN